MTMKRTLGGDRLGSGKKMQIELHNYERSTHDLGYIWRSTMSAGTLVPFLCEVALPGDTFDIDLDCDIKTHPTIGPLFGSYKVQLDIFQAPLRLYNSLLHNNTLRIGMDMSQVKLPQIELTAKPVPLNNLDYDNSQINASCLINYLGIRGVGYTTTEVTRYFNASSLLMYWDVYKNYYANKQEGQGAVIHVAQPPINETITSVNVEVSGTDYALPQYPSTGATPTLVQGETFIDINYTGTLPEPETIQVLYSPGTIWQPLTTLWVVISQSTGTYRMEYTGGPGRVLLAWDYSNSQPPAQTRPIVTLFDLENIDDMRNNILAFQSKTTPFIIDASSPEPYKWLCEEQQAIPNILSSQEGLAIKTYQNDLFNNWLDTTWVDDINTATSISTATGSFSIDQLNLSKKTYEYLNRIAASGGSYDDWQDATWAHERYRRCESPMYEGGLIRELVFQEVVSNSQTDEQPLGTLAGKGIMASKKKGGKIIVKVDEPGYIMGIISLTPRVDYSQGNKWDVNLETMNDLHKPAFDQIGFQDLITEQQAWWSTTRIGTEWVQKSAGKQPAWLNYMTNVNVTKGNFAYSDNEMFMTLNRRYEIDATDMSIRDLTTYIDPAKFNFIFAETSIDAQNFWAQISVNITARRKMSAKIMPNV